MPRVGREQSTRRREPFFVWESSARSVAFVDLRRVPGDVSRLEPGERKPDSSLVSTRSRRLA
jgi:hypothetical protein